MRDLAFTPVDRIAAALSGLVWPGKPRRSGS
jgi:hypothetical protein